MAKLPEPRDPTLEAADRALEHSNVTHFRHYLGMSGAGKECPRALWYEFRWVQRAKHDAFTLKRFADGHVGEDTIIKRLRLVEGVTLLSLDPETGKQFHVEAFGGHFAGHMDGQILGLLQAPKTTHVFEAKVTGEKQFRAFQNAKLKHGEKLALSYWNDTYFAQAQLYMHYGGFKRHYCVVVTPGVREWDSCRTEYHKGAASYLVQRAASVIFADRPPERISEDPDKFPCSWCDFKDICHNGAVPNQILDTCRSCIHITPQTNGEWHCRSHDRPMDYREQLVGCDRHRLIPVLLQAEQIDAAADGSWVKYRLPSGEIWTDA